MLFGLRELAADLIPFEKNIALRSDWRIYSSKSLNGNTPFPFPGSPNNAPNI